MTDDRTGSDDEDRVESTENTGPRSEAEQHDPAFRRLQDADPAADVTADLDLIRATVEARTAEPAAAPRAWRWSQIAAAVVAVAVVGAGGYLIGAGTHGGGSNPAASSAVAGSTVTTTAADQPVPDVVAGGAGVPGVAPEVAPPSAALGMSRSATGGAASDSMFYGGYRNVFSDGGVSTEAGTGQAWAFDASQAVSAATAERLAAAFGVSGTAVANYNSWMVGPADYSGPVLQLSGDGTASFNFSDPTVPGMYCPVPEPAITDGGVTMMSTYVCPSPTGPVLDPATAVARTGELLSALGFDPAAFEIVAPPEASTEYYTSVTAYPLVAGSRTDIAWWFSFAGDRLSNASGQAAPIVAAGEYSLVSPAEAVARLNDPRFGASGPVYPLDYNFAKDTDMPPAPASDVVTTPPAPSPGGVVPWPVNEVTITGATLGLGSHYLPDGTVRLLPTYTLTDGEGLSWTVIALADDQLDFSTG